MEETRLAMQKRADSGLPGSFRSRWQENNPRSVPNAGFVQRVPNSVLAGTTPMLCWASEREANVLVGYSQVNLEHEPDQGAGRRHARATLYYWEQVLAQKKFLPDLYKFPE